MTTLFALLLAWQPGWGGSRAAEEIKSGPQPGQVLPGPMQSWNVTGEHAGSLHCLVCEYGLQPVVLVVAREPPERGGSLANLLKKLDEAVERHRDQRLASFVVFLSPDVKQTDSRDALARRLGDLARALELKHVVFCLYDAAGPRGYAVNPRVEITVVLYRDQTVLANSAFERDRLTDKDVEAILAGVAKALKK
jgi:hypothetical protein